MTTRSLPLAAACFLAAALFCGPGECADHCRFANRLCQDRYNQPLLNTEVMGVPKQSAVLANGTLYVRNVYAVGTQANYNTTAKGDRAVISIDAGRNVRKVVVDNVRVRHMALSGTGNNAVTGVLVRTQGGVPVELSDTDVKGQVIQGHTMSESGMTCVGAICVQAKGGGEITVDNVKTDSNIHATIK